MCDKLYQLDKQTARERVVNVRTRARLLREEKKRQKAWTGGKASLDGERRQIEERLLKTRLTCYRIHDGIDPYRCVRTLASNTVFFVLLRPYHHCVSKPYASNSKHLQFLIHWL